MYQKLNIIFDNVTR